MTYLLTVKNKFNNSVFAHFVLAIKNKLVPKT